MKNNKGRIRVAAPTDLDGMKMLAKQTAESFDWRFAEGFSTWDNDSLDMPSIQRKLERFPLESKFHKMESK